MSPGHYVNFSDCDAHVIQERSLLAYLAQRLDLPELAALARTQPADGARDNLTWGLRRIFWQLPADTPARFTPARHDWYGGMTWMIARFNPADPDALLLAAKGGHNQEMHNQNDVGNLIVHVKGESVIADVGRGRYTKDYFREKRYEHFVNSSLGHSVPVPNGQYQRNGRAYAARLIEHLAGETQDLLHIEMKDAYPAEAGLASLQRRVVLHRQPPRGWVELEDTVRFQEGPGTFESALTTFGQVEIGEDALVIQGLRGKLRVGFDEDIVDVRVDLHADIDFPHGPVDVRRIVFALKKPAQAGSVRLEIEPID